MKNKYKDQMKRISPDEDFEERLIFLLGKSKIKKVNYMSLKTVKIIMAAVIVIVAAASTAVAAIRYLSPNEVAEAIGEPLLAEAFRSESAILTDQSYTGTVSSTGIEYTMHFLGAVCGKDIPKDIENLPSYSDTSDECEHDENGYYLVFSIERTDGEKWSEETDGFLPITVYPIVNGIKPWQLELHTLGAQTFYDENMNVTYTIFYFNGVFAEKMRLIAFEGMSPNNEKLIYNDESGYIGMNPDFKGFITEFEVPAELIEKAGSR